MFAKFFTLLACLALVQSELIRVPLKKVKSVRQTRREPELIGKRQSLLGKYQLSSNKTPEFYGEISIGTPPQTFTFFLDTFLSDSWVMSSKCIDCESSNEYSSNTSSTYKPNGTHIETDYGFDTFTGFLSSDNVQVGGITVTGQLFAEITKEISYGDFIDGFLGLGYQPVSANGVPAVMANLFAQHTDLLPAFAFYLKNSDGQTDGEMTIGEADSRYYKGDFKYAPVVKNQPNWKIKVDQIIVGSTFDVIKGPREAVVDTATSVIVGSPEEVKTIYEAIGAKALPMSNIYAVDCNKTLPDINFVVNGQNLTLTYKDYTYYDDEFSICEPQFYYVNGYDGPWVLGTPFIKKFYTQFDLKNSRIGFAELK